MHDKKMTILKLLYNTVKPCVDTFVVFNFVGILTFDLEILRNKRKELYESHEMGERYMLFNLS